VRVVLFKGPSQYDGVRTFIDELAAAFAARGDAADVVDLAGVADVEAAIAGPAASPADLVLSINILGDHRDRRARGVSEIFGAPHVSYYVDYGLSLAARLRATPPTTSVLLVDPTQVEAVRSIFGADRFASVGFCPHGAVGEPAPDEDAVEFAGREIPILWSGTFQRPGAPIWEGQSPAIRKIYEDAVDLALGVEWMAPHEAFDRVLTANGNDITDPRLAAARCDASHIDVRVRVIRRFELISRLGASGLPMVVAGNGWEGQQGLLPNARFLGPLPMLPAVAAMGRARIVVSSNGNFGAGSHERPLSALLAGAAAFSDHSRFYGEVFAEGEEIALFRWKALDDGIAQLAQLHADPGAAWAIARRGKAKVAAGHRWAHRVDAILAAAEASRARLGATPP
jgi:hypothetical protein